MRGFHDMGGMPAGPVERSEHDYAFWERRIDALMMLLSSPDRRLVKVDENRRAIEQLGPDVYNSMSYYERWIAAIVQVLMERGTITADELGRKMAEVEARETAARSGAATV